MAVAKELRGKKIGKRMISDAEVWAEKQGFNCVYVDSSNDVVGFYEKCGYDVEYGQFINDPSLLMKKEILNSTKL